MGFLSILKKVRLNEKEMRLLVLGLDNAGKTTVVKFLNGEDVNSTSPTLGFQISTLEFDGFRLNIWDIGGQKTIRTYWRNYFEQTDGLIWVVDSADVSRLDDCKQELASLLKEERLAGASLLILANKQDLSGALSSDEISQALGLTGDKRLDIGVSRHWRIEPCAARFGDAEGKNSTQVTTSRGIAQGFQWIVQDISQRIFYVD